MNVVPPSQDPEVDRLIDRLLNPTPEDRAHWEEFNKLRDLVENCRAALGWLTEEQSQLVGLYLLSARDLGAGEDHDPRPTLDKPARPDLRIVE